MTLIELQNKLEQEKLKQFRQKQNEYNKKQNIKLRRELYSYLPKVNEWLQMLNMIHNSGTKLFVSETQYLKTSDKKRAWVIITERFYHNFGLYRPKADFYNFYLIALPNQTFTKMGCDESGCDGYDMWTDGKEWYHGNCIVKYISNEISEYKLKRTIDRIKKFEIYFNELLETLGN